MPKFHQKKLKVVRDALMKVKKIVLLNRVCLIKELIIVPNNR